MQPVLRRLAGINTQMGPITYSQAEKLRRLNALQGSAYNAGRAAREFTNQVGSGALLGATTGGVSNYLSGGDLDHALRGALTGGIMGGVGGRLLRNVNPLLRTTTIAGVPAVLGQVKDRPDIARYFRPESSDSISGLYTEERAFTEGSPEWEEYYAANPHRYDIRYGQQKEAAFTTSVDGSGSALDLDYYRLHQELREKGYNRQEREELLRNDFGTQLKDLGRGLGYGALGALGVGALARGIGSASPNMSEHTKDMLTSLGMVGGGLGGTLLAARDIYNMDQEAIEAAETIGRKKEASLTLNDIASMESMSGVNVGRTRTKVGMIIDSNGVYTLYDDTGKYTYGEFTKLSEAQEHAEKVAKFYSEFNPTANEYQTVRRNWWKPFGKGQVITGSPADYTGKGWSGTRRVVDHGRMSAAVDATKSKNIALKNPFIEEGRQAGVKATQQEYANKDKTMQRYKDRATRFADKYRSSQLELEQTRKRGVDAINSLNKQHQAAIKAEQEAAQKALAAQTQKTTDAAKSLARWKKGTGIVGGLLAAGGLGYGLYKSYSKPKTFAERASESLNQAVDTMSDYKQYLPMANQFASTLSNVGGAVGKAAFNPYSASQGSYQQMPSYNQNRYRYYN